MENKKTAEFTQMRNDLFWKYTDHHDGHFAHLKWTGYDDTYWWQNVSESENAQIRKCEHCEKRFKINFNLNEIIEL